MYIIAGLGNPGKEYDRTRHNVGFEVIDRIADKEGINVSSEKHRAVIGSGMIGGEKVLLVKPQTFMNLSGESIGELADYYHIDPATELIVISDDIDLDPGKIRIRVRGSAGGHNGLKNIIAHTGSDFIRIRVGTGAKPAGYDLADYVLGHFDKDTQAVMDETYIRAGQAVEMIIKEGPEKAMNCFNG
jgi:PTH1 family peptidyl-tRNA hydrolase